MWCLWSYAMSLWTDADGWLPSDLRLACGALELPSRMLETASDSICLNDSSMLRIPLLILEISSCIMPTTVSRSDTLSLWLPMIVLHGGLEGASYTKLPSYR
ncbi:unnamed protein product [Brassica rapa subsp. narinosa]